MMDCCVDSWLSHVGEMEANKGQGSEGIHRKAVVGWSVESGIRERCR